MLHEINYGGINLKLESLLLICSHVSLKVKYFCHPIFFERKRNLSFDQIWKMRKRREKNRLTTHQDILPNRSEERSILEGKVRKPSSHSFRPFFDIHFYQTKNQGTKINLNDYFWRKKNPFRNFYFTSRSILFRSFFR